MIDTDSEIFSSEILKKSSIVIDRWTELNQDDYWFPLL